MRITVTESIFRDTFIKMGRSDNFSYQGLTLLFDYFESIDCDIELDIIAICCDFIESDINDINVNYDKDFDDLYEAMEWLQDQTAIVGVTDDTVVYSQF